MTFQEIETQIGRTVRVKYNIEGRPQIRAGVILKADMERIEIEPFEGDQDHKDPQFTGIEDSKIIVQIKDIETLDNLI